MCQIWTPYHKLWHGSILTFFSNKKIKKVKKYSKSEILWHGVFLCVLVARENDKLEFWQNFHKTSSQKGQSSINMYKFRGKWRRYDHPRAIVCYNVSIFDTYVCLVMTKNVAELIFFQITFINIIFHFLIIKNDIFFVKQVWQIWYKMAHIQFSHKVGHILSIIQKC